MKKMTAKTLDLIDLDQKRTGYREFLSCWAYQEDGLTVLVDPGPVSTVEHLFGMLENLEIVEVDYVLLTHIHLDHGGCAAEVLERFNNARLFCHRSAVKHMVSPAALWEGSKKVLADVADMYGQPNPVPREKIADSEELSARGIKVVTTPGHAPHHVSFLINDVLFVGEAVGNRVELPSGKPYLRPSTPPKFVLDVAQSSLKKLLRLEPEPKWIAFAHYGLAGETFRWCRRAQKQLGVWVETIRALYKESDEDLEERFFERLMEIDPLYGRGRFDELAEDIQVREREFLENTLKGMLGHIKPEAAIT